MYQVNVKTKKFTDKDRIPVFYAKAISELAVRFIDPDNAEKPDDKQFMFESIKPHIFTSYSNSGYLNKDVCIYVDNGTVNVLDPDRDLPQIGCNDIRAAVGAQTLNESPVHLYPVATNFVRNEDRGLNVKINNNTSSIYVNYLGTFDAQNTSTNVRTMTDIEVQKSSIKSEFDEQLVASGFTDMDYAAEDVVTKRFFALTPKTLDMQEHTSTSIGIHHQEADEIAHPEWYNRELYWGIALGLNHVKGTCNEYTDSIISFATCPGKSFTDILYGVAVNKTFLDQELTHNDANPYSSGGGAIGKGEPFPSWAEVEPVPPSFVPYTLGDRTYTGKGFFWKGEYTVCRVWDCVGTH